ncbi:MAG: hypothetical protein PF542_02495 [Nanoarchaeota archaeon]|jgi:hypothetical protein|nr:hypothetical protein [Nanoarchaeota archaeon]
MEDENKMKINKGLFALLAVALLGVGVVSASAWMNSDNHEAIESAIESGDYNAWNDAHLDTLTQENFKIATERHASMTQMREVMEDLREARDAGDEDLVSELQVQLEELRSEGFLGMRGATGKGAGKGMHGGEGSFEGMRGDCALLN